MRHLRPTTTLALLALSLAACARCGAPSGGPPPARFVPADAAGALVIPELGRLASQAAALHGRLVPLDPTGDLAALRAGLGHQLTFDPLDPASLSGAGLDPARGAAVAVMPGPAGRAGPPLLVLPVGDASAFEALVGRVARERLGASISDQVTADGAAVTVWRRAAGQPPLLSLAVVERTALVSAGPEGTALVARAARLAPGDALEASAPLAKARVALPGQPALVAWIPPGSPALAGQPTSAGAAIGLSGGAAGLDVGLASLLSPADEARLRPLAPGPAPTAAPSRLDPSTVLAMRLGAEPAALATFAARAPPPLAGLLATLSPGVELGVALDAHPDPAALLGRAPPLRALRLELVAGVRDPAALGALLASEAKAGRITAAGPGRWRVPTPEGELMLALDGGRLVAAAGPAGSLDALLARLAAGAPGFVAPTGTSAAALQGRLGGAVLHAANLVAALKRIDPAALGGPEGIEARLLVDRLTGPGAALTALSVRADLPEGALTLAASLELGEPAPAPR